MPSPEKFEKTLQDFAVDSRIVEKIYSGFGKPVSKTPKKVKAAFFSQALTVMNQNLPEQQVKAILEANACCKSGVRERNSKEFARIYGDLSIRQRLELISSRPYLNMGSAYLDEQGSLIVQGVSYRLDNRYECACPTVSRVKREHPIPKEYCYCCGGHFRYHYEVMLGVKLDLVEILSSPHDSDGSQPCVFKFRIEET